MNVLLIRPPSDTHLVFPPMGLLYLAACIRKEHKVKIIDCLLEKNNFELYKEVLRKERFNVVGVTAFSCQIDSAYRAAEIAKRINPNVIVVIGGIHASTRPRDVIGNKNVDFVFAGECENSFPEFLKNIEKKKSVSKIKGIVYRGKSGKIKMNPGDIIKDLDCLPMPAWDLLPPNRYPEIVGQLNHPIAPVITSRGCPYQCTFCSGHLISGRGWRFRNPEKIIDEISYLKERYGIKEIYFMDDNMTFDKERMKKICNLLIEKKINISWACPNGVRADRLDEELLKLMKKAGCYTLNFGIESGSPRILKMMKKNLDYDKLKSTIKLSRKTGILTAGTFILGYPGETRKEIAETLKVAKNLGLDRALFFTFQPLPGSEIFDYLVKNGKINQEEIGWKKYSYSDVSWVTDTIGSKKDLKNLQRKAILSFYLRPRILLSYAGGLKSLKMVKSFAKLVKSYLFKK